MRWMLLMILFYSSIDFHFKELMQFYTKNSIYNDNMHINCDIMNLEMKKILKKNKNLPVLRIEAIKCSPIWITRNTKNELFIYYGKFKIFKPNFYLDGLPIFSDKKFIKIKSVLGNYKISKNIKTQKNKYKKIKEELSIYMKKLTIKEGFILYFLMNINKSNRLDENDLITNCNTNILIISITSKILNIDKLILNNPQTIINNKNYKKFNKNFVKIKVLVDYILGLTIK